MIRGILFMVGAVLTLYSRLTYWVCDDTFSMAWMVSAVVADFAGLVIMIVSVIY